MLTAVCRIADERATAEIDHQIWLLRNVLWWYLLPPGLAMPQVKAGRIRALAITSAKRSAMAPALPTIAESGYPGFEASVWYGVVGPAGSGKRTALPSAWVTPAWSVPRIR